MPKANETEITVRLTSLKGPVPKAYLQGVVRQTLQAAFHSRGEGINCEIVNDPIGPHAGRALGPLPGPMPHIPHRLPDTGPPRVPAAPPAPPAPSAPPTPPKRATRGSKK
jgi:hypothetical protein